MRAAGLSRVRGPLELVRHEITITATWLSKTQCTGNLLDQLQCCRPATLDEAMTCEDHKVDVTFSIRANIEYREETKLSLDGFLHSALGLRQSQAPGNMHLACLIDPLPDRCHIIISLIDGPQHKTGATFNPYCNEQIELFQIAQPFAIHSSSAEDQADDIAWENC